MARRTPRKEGMVVAVPLEGGRFGFGRALREPLIEFFGSLEPTTDVDIETIVRQPVIFRIWVMNSAITSGRWPVIGTAPLTAADAATRHVFFRKDAISGALSLYWTDPLTGEPHEEPAREADCAPLERASVWSAEHVEDRLRDHFDSKPNKWVESLRVRP